MKTHFEIKGFLGTVDMRKPVIEGANFTWGECLHWKDFNYLDIREPREAKHAYNIVNLIKAVQPLREHLGMPMRVTSCYRPEPYNSRAGGVKNSKHLVGMAMDFWIPGQNHYALAKHIYDHYGWQGGVGGYPNFVHIDTGRRHKWGF